MDDIDCPIPSLIRAKYHSTKLKLESDSWGLYKYSNWLPISHTLKGSSAPVTYHSRALAEYLDMPHLYITFSGYFPRIGAHMTTCSFKETEAYSVCGRLSEDSEGRVMVVASAGNTARAFAKVCSENHIPLLLVVPEDNIDALWFCQPLDECVKLITTQHGSDYFDAISLANTLCSSQRFYGEGGAKNIARRDGMGCTMLSAVTAIGTIPDVYLQAIGSGTGAIAAWETNMRLLEDGRWGDKLSRLHLSQNAPFTPMYDSWLKRSCTLLPYEAEQARHAAEHIDAKVLSNRHPPYSIKGGLYDALRATDGDIVAVSNPQLRAAKELFRALEGVDIYSASAVAVASLIDGLASGAIKRDEVVMLNITGGGEELYKRRRELWYLKPSLCFDIEASKDDIISKTEVLF